MNQVIRQCLIDALLPEGFKRKGNDWTRSLDETVHIVNLQRSRWSEAYYINLAVWIKGLGDPPAVLKENHCHIRQRLGGAQLEKALDAAESMDDLKRTSVIRLGISRRALPFFKSCANLASIKAALKGGKFDNAFVAAQVHAL